MDEYRKFLALKVLNEDAIINYKQLSRALKVHTHLAKQMLYEFHHTTNAKKTGSIHATYLITGILRSETQPPSQPTHSQLHAVSQNEDTSMDSSPFPSSMPNIEPGPSLEPEDPEPPEEVIPNTTTLLAREEELEETKAEFDEIQSIFVYSLEPGPLKDFQLLAQCNREVTKEFWKEDPLVVYEKYGIITNKDVRRRTGKRPPPPVEIKVPADTSKQPAKAAAVASVKAAQPEAVKKDDPAKIPTTSKPATSNSKPAPTIRRQSSDLFKSFAKSKPPKLKTSDSNATSASGSANPSPIDKEIEKEDAEMAGMSDDEAEAEPEPIDETAMAEEVQRVAEARKARKEKEEKLKAMMEESDEDMDDVTQEPVEPEEESAPLDKPAEPEKKEEVTTSNGRRRGRRKVTKKRTYKDEDGYLVTKEEAAWESFSEDEPEPKKPKMAPIQAKKKTGPAPKGQGNLMSFFKKK